MATVTNRGTPLADTTNTAAYATASFTPVAGELLVVMVQATGTVASAPTLSASANGLTFVRLPTVARKNTNVDTQWMFVANQLVPASPASMVLNFSCSQDAATGCIIAIAGVAGMSKVGSAAVRQQGSGNNFAGGTAPSATFPFAPLAENALLFAAHTSVQTGRTPPVGWTEQVDVAYATPATGGGYSSRDSGFTGLTVTSTDSTSGPCSALALELDTSTDVPAFSGWGIPI